MYGRDPCPTAQCRKGNRPRFDGHRCLWVSLPRVATILQLLVYSRGLLALDLLVFLVGQIAGLLGGDRWDEFEWLEDWLAPTVERAHRILGSSRHKFAD
jgi:hypothetical protein